MKTQLSLSFRTLEKAQEQAQEKAQEQARWAQRQARRVQQPAEEKTEPLIRPELVKLHKGGAKNARKRARGEKQHSIKVAIENHPSAEAVAAAANTDFLLVRDEIRSLKEKITELESKLKELGGEVEDCQPEDPEDFSELDVFEDYIKDMKEYIQILKSGIKIASILVLDSKEVLELHPRPKRNGLERSAYILLLDAHIIKLDPRITAFSKAADDAWEITELDGRVLKLGDVDVITYLEDGLKFSESDRPTTKRNDYGNRSKKVHKGIQVKQMQIGGMVSEGLTFCASDVATWAKAGHIHKENRTRRRLSIMARLCKETKMAAMRD